MSETVLEIDSAEPPARVAAVVPPVPVTTRTLLDGAPLSTPRASP